MVIKINDVSRKMLTSEMYNTTASMENGIQYVMKNGPVSPVVDES